MASLGSVSPASKSSSLRVVLGTTGLQLVSEGKVVLRTVLIQQLSKLLQWLSEVSV